ncbi:phosphoribosylformylglycinamidine cycl [Patellaria atrata CBS 101060]|uniref:Homoserine kinase n=1 Tax=Patellaria atrata CBS 101060 TaxID=1346257 RepID=A0A9P4SIJ7_9PEZI|nr:phosphoribosylformylglycinamidine cycl [Patellaria atrata CBS 101060]
MIAIRVPCSSANIGPGFDVVGLGLNIYLELQVRIDTTTTSSNVPLNCKITYEGVGAEEVSLIADENLITRTALYVLRCHNQSAFPVQTHVHIINPIPLGRGLGSSGAAVVAGAALANEVGNLGLSKDRLLDFCLMIERHPDNVAAALYGGFVGTYLNELDPEDMARKEIPLSEVLPQPAGGVDTGLKPPVPPLNIGHHIKFRWAKEIKCIAIIPDFEVPTAEARKVLQVEYKRADVIFNLQRIALLTTALGQSPPDPRMIYDGMQDKVHQNQRMHLVPGLEEVLKSVTPQSHPGLLGICLSGAGPTILALATENFETISQNIKNIMERYDSPESTSGAPKKTSCLVKVLEPAEDGMTVFRKPESETSQVPAGPRMTYADAGVSIEAGNELVHRIKAAVASTARPGASAEIGGFGGILDLDAAGFPRAPKIVSAIDGVGTKLKIAVEMNDHSGVGVDLVAMNVNDLVVQGAQPLAFLDYIASSKLELETAAQFVESVARGCREAGCALVGGETAEMPGIYTGKEYDAAGAAIGTIPHGQKILPDLDAMKEGDVLLGLASSGQHSNGFSLTRRILEARKLSYQSKAPWDETKSVGESLLTPTRIYVKPLLKLTEKGLTKGMAHVTGGGLYDNVPRMLPEHLAAEMDVSTWSVPDVLSWLKKAGNVDAGEFARVWNTGLGMVVVVAKERVEEAVGSLKESGEVVFTVGTLVKRTGERCVLKNLEKWN